MLRHPARLAGASLLRLQSDERLAELALQGHEAAFAAIVDRYRAALLRYSAGIVGAARAEDAVQQALINAHDALKRTTEVRHLRSWLYRITHNATLNMLRSMRDDLPLDPAHAALGEGPDAAFERREQLRATLDAVRDLPERQRAALLLRELEGRSHEEIAAALGVTKGAARQQLMRARATVRTAATALTPYPLIAKLATAMAAGPSAAGWAEAAAGAGAGVTLTKLTAGVVATGALLGGAVGTQQVVRQHARHGTGHSARDAARPARTPAQAGGGVASGAAVVTPAALTGLGAGPDPTPSGDRTTRRQARGSGGSDARRGSDHHGAAVDQSDGRTSDDHSTTTGSRDSSGGDGSGGGTSGRDGQGDGRGSRDGGDHHSVAESDSPGSGTGSGDRRGSSGSSGDDGRGAPSSSGGSKDAAAPTEPDVSREPQSGSGSEGHPTEDTRSRGSGGSGSPEVPAPTGTTPLTTPEP